MTGADEKALDSEMKGLAKFANKKGPGKGLTTRLKHQIIAVNGNRDTKVIREFVDNYMLARDSRAFREHISKIQPDVDLTFFPSTSTKSISLPIGINFFWPDANVG